MEEVIINDPMRLMETQEVAAILRTSQKTVQKYCREGEIPAIPIGGRWYVRREDLDAWLDRHVQGGV